VGWWLFPILPLDGFTYAVVVFGSIAIITNCGVWDFFIT
jgi:hypothetical protein